MMTSSFLAYRRGGLLLRSTALSLVLSAGACIQRTAPPPTSSGVSASVAPSPATATALEAANAKIAAFIRTDLLGGAGIKAFQPSGEIKKVVATTVPVSGQAFREALRLEVKEGSDHEWAVQLQASNTQPVAQGDVLLTTFFLRTEKPQEGGPGETEFVFELANPPYAKSIQYPVQAGGEWVKVQAPFKAARAYTAAEAHILFRLGYDPQIIELGDIKVENFGQATPLNVFPTTQVIDRKREKVLAAAAVQGLPTLGTVVEGGPLEIRVNPSQVVRPISPYVYGVNSQPIENTGVTVRRMGGNRQTAYNWEINASNAGHDYNHQSDEWACTVLGYKDCGKPAAQFVDFARDNRAAHVESVATVPLVDYVAGDKAGPVKEKESAPSPRWVRSYPQRPGSMTDAPDLNDAVVYQDELVHYLVGQVGKSDAGGIRFYSLDNEPALWSQTHPRVHPAKASYAEVVRRSSLTASALLKQDPGALILGGVMYGWSEYMTLQDAEDAKEQNEKLGPDGTYVDFFLSEMKRLEGQYKRRLVHVLDLHWFPEARGAKRITENDISPRTVTARLQAPRSLWDPTYTEKSWIAAQWGKPIRLIPWVEERIAQRYPGTKLSFSAYDFGGGEHISGGLAQADVLGVFGREGVYLANYWGNGAGNNKLPPYIAAAYRLFRNYNGKNGAFGDTAVVATPSDQTKASVFAATDSHQPGHLTVLVINKDLLATFSGELDLHGGGKQATYNKVAVYALDGSSAEVRPVATAEIKNNKIAYRLPPLSATLFVCDR